MFKQLLTLLMFSIIGNALFAQAQITYSPEAKLPMDSKIIHGVLSNGLTYYILANKTPEKRAEFYLVNNVGAMQETPGQNGFAHLTEHMAFNGTKNFPKKEIISYLESIGVKFGADINAYTNTDETVYTLYRVPVEEPANIDTSLLILYDWATNVSMETDEINSERNVVREEKRDNWEGADFRMVDSTDKVLYEGSKYATHNVIGITDVLLHSPVDTLRAFYNDWYRPDLQAIIVVGDINPADIEAKIKTIFSKLPVKKNPKERIYYQIPDHKDIKVVIVQDKDAKETIVDATYKKPIVQNKNEESYRQAYVNALYSMMITSRLQETAQKPDAPFLQAYSKYEDLVRTKDQYYTDAVTSEDKIEVALDAILSENERVKKYGFLDSELERAKKTLSSAIERQYNERNKKQSAQIADVIQDNFLTGKPLPSPEWRYQFGNLMLSQISLDEVNKAAKKLVTDENLVIAVTTVKKDGFVPPTKEDLLTIAKNVHTKKLEQYVDGEANKPLIPQKIVPGTIVKQEEDKKNGVTRLELSNGVKVVIKKTDFKDDQILMTAISEGGFSKYDLKDNVSARVAAEVVEMSGLGDFNLIDLQKKLTGTQASITPYIYEIEEGFRGNSDVSSFSTLLQLNYLYFTAPRADKDAFDNYKQQQTAALKTQSTDPQSVFMDTARNVINQHSAYRKDMALEMLDQANLNRIKYIFSDRFSDPSGFTYYFVGNIDLNSQKDTILKYLGGLPTVKRNETWTDLGARIATQRVENHFTSNITTDKATVLVAYTGNEKKYTIEEGLLLDAVKEYLQVRYFETLREDQGGTYSPATFSEVTHYPANQYLLGAYFDSDPVKLDTMVKIVYNEVDKLIANGPDAKVVQNIALNKLKEHNEQVKENSYWLQTLFSDDFDKVKHINYDYDKFWENLTPKKVQAAAKKYLDKNSTIEIIRQEKQ